MRRRHSGASTVADRKSGRSVDAAIRPRGLLRRVCRGRADAGRGGGGYCGARLVTFDAECELVGAGWGVEPGFCGSVTKVKYHLFAFRLQWLQGKLKVSGVFGGGFLVGNIHPRCMKVDAESAFDVFARGGLENFGGGLLAMVFRQCRFSRPHVDGDFWAVHKVRNMCVVGKQQAQCVGSWRQIEHGFHLAPPEMQVVCIKRDRFVRWQWKLFVE